MVSLKGLDRKRGQPDVCMVVMYFRIAFGALSLDGSASATENSVWLSTKLMAIFDPSRAMLLLFVDAQPRSHTTMSPGCGAGGAALAMRCFVDLARAQGTQWGSSCVPVITMP